MAAKTTNKLIPLLALVGVVVTVGIIIKHNNDQTSVALPNLKESKVPDADSTSDTLRTLTAEVRQVQQDNKSLKVKLNETSQKLAKANHQPPAPDQKTQTSLQNLWDKVNTLAQNQQDALHGKDKQPVDDYKLPDSAPIGDVWIEPADSDSSELAKNGVLPNTSSFSTSLSDDTKSVTQQASDLAGDSMDAISKKVGETLPSTKTQPKVTDTPVYTVPKNSTLMGATAMTALVGRVPVNGSVQDPYPVKIIVGKDNLTANGMDIPEVSQMIFSGTATGDWTLSCVRVDLTSVTYVFDDGTIRTLSVGDKKLTADGNSNANRLAWISDERGIPCVTGKRISNAASYLAGTIFAKGVEAGAKAVAKAETTSVVSAQGDTTTSVTGNALKNAGFDTLSGGASAVSKWLDQRQQQNFDIVYVDVGAHVAVHVDTQLPIDYEPNGRKLRYDQFSKAGLNNNLD